MTGTILVALPAITGTHDLVAEATRVAAEHGITATGPVDHFTHRPPAAVRLLHHDLGVIGILAAATVFLLDLVPPAQWPHHNGWMTTTLTLIAVVAGHAWVYRRGLRPLRRIGERCRRRSHGGQIRTLDLRLMRRQARRAAHARWTVWNRVVAGTPAAHPFWVFRDRVVADPAAWTITRAQRAYRSQRRVRAMDLYCADPDRRCDLPRKDLEILQHGADAYRDYHGLAAVPADGLIDATGGRHTIVVKPGDILDDAVDYLIAADQILGRLRKTCHLVALSC